MMKDRDAWLAIVQDGDDSEETELVFLDGIIALEGATIETTAGVRITLTERVGPAMVDSGSQPRISSS